MKKFLTIAFGTVPMLGTGASFAQGGGMMSGDGWGTGWMGGIGVPWTLILLLVVIAGLVSWIVARNRK